VIASDQQCSQSRVQRDLVSRDLPGRVYIDLSDHHNYPILPSIIVGDASVVATAHNNVLIINSAGSDDEIAETVGFTLVSVDHNSALGSFFLLHFTSPIRRVNAMRAQTTRCAQSRRSEKI
jgi:hypothetical protein